MVWTDGDADKAAKRRQPQTLVDREKSASNISNMRQKLKEKAHKMSVKQSEAAKAFDDRQRSLDSLKTSNSKEIQKQTDAQMRSDLFDRSKPEGRRRYGKKAAGSSAGSQHQADGEEDIVLDAENLDISLPADDKMENNVAASSFAGLPLLSRATSLHKWAEVHPFASSEGWVPESRPADNAGMPKP